MKKQFLITYIAGMAILFSACNGDHSDRSGIDTVKNRYGTDTSKTPGSNTDTGKITTTTGDASSLDNSGSGGTKIAKDTSKQKSTRKSKEK
jgi:hypothetical protein